MCTFFPYVSFFFKKVAPVLPWCRFWEVWRQLIVLLLCNLFHLLAWSSENVSLKSNSITGICLRADHYIIINFSHYPFQCVDASLLFFLELHSFDSLFSFFKKSSYTCYNFVCLALQLLSLWPLFLSVSNFKIFCFPGFL